MVVQDNADNHTHHVNVENGVPVPCECPADAYHDGTCKYRVTVAIHEPVLAAATTDDSRDRISTDGGDLIVAGELGIIYKVITDAVVAGMEGSNVGNRPADQE